MNRRRSLQLGATFLVAAAGLWLLFLVTSPARAQDTAPLSPYSSWFPNDSDDTGSVARGDTDGDGDLDLSPSNSGLYGGPYQANQVFENRGQSLIQTPASDPFSLAWTSAEADVINVFNLQKFGSVAWGDYDGDGDLDLVAATYNCTPAKLYRNDGGMLTSQAVQTLGFRDWQQSVAWGDWDGDGDLDLVVGNWYSYDCGPDYPAVPPANRVYRNDTEPGVLTPTLTLVWSSQNESNDWTYSVAWGDVDGDGDLDLAVGNWWGQPNRVYLNYTEENPDVADADRLVLAWSSWNERYDVTTSVAWGDVDGDGDLDLAVGNLGGNRLYRNDTEPGVLTPTFTLVWSSQNESNDWTYSVAWGDLDSDGDLDLVAGNGCLSYFPYTCYPNRVYRNDSAPGVLTPTLTLAWSSSGESDSTNSIALGDYDGDGDLDLLVSNLAHPNRLYRNDSVPGALTPTLTLAWSASGVAMTTDVAWGDMDGDGDLDLAVRNNGPSLVYRNTLGTPLSPDPVWSSQELTNTASVAWGDVDSDGDLDLAVGNYGQPNRVYRNTTILDGVPNPDVADETRLVRAWSSEGYTLTISVAWGDLDGDGDLDLVAGNGGQPNLVYSNDNGMLTADPVWQSAEEESTRSIVLGDYDGDGDLDLSVWNEWGYRNRLYRNDSEPGVVTLTLASWSSEPGEPIKAMTWGDYDGDGDLDWATGGYFIPIRLYRNDGVIGGEPQMPEVWSWGNPAVGSLAWGDVDGDGDLDLAVGTRYAYPNWLFRNDNGMLTADPVWQSAEGEPTTSVAWGDVDGDGDLDLAVGNDCEPFTGVCSPNRLYRNDTEPGVLTPTLTLAWSSWNEWYDNTTSVAWGDVDGDGDLDLAVGNGCFGGTCYPDRLYRNNRDRLALPGSVPVVRVTRPAPPGNADFFSAPNVWSDVIPIVYTLVHPQRTPVRFIRADYSPDGGGLWRSAVAASGTSTTDLFATPTGEPYVFMWDTFASDFFGQSDNVVVRIEAVPGIMNALHGVPGPYLYGSYASQTFPFRVRGTQVKVFSGTVAPGNEVAGAMVYRLPKDETTGGTLMVDYAGNAFRTDQNGDLQGRGVIAAGDRLLALAPVPLPPEYTARYSDTMRLYYTNGTPTEAGLEAYTVPLTPGVQVITVTAEHPLILFDLDVSLEWDAHNEPTYLDQLEFDLKKASRHLYDFTDGQVALGEVTVYQNADNWAFTHVDVHATNHLRPFATIGGMVLTDTIYPGRLPITSTYSITYSIGQVNMGSTWNRYGNPGQSLGEDWPLALAHELSHFLLFLEDTYLGLDEDDLLIAVDSCTGSAMGDTYAVTNTEFVTRPAWRPKCEDTLAEKVLERSEWETIGLWYPWLKTPGTSNPGPSLMPFGLTTVEIRDPMTRTNALQDPAFYLDYAGDEVGSAGARAFLLRKGDSNADFEYVYRLGSPVGGQNRLLARGAQPGDRLCVFDQARRQYGCEDIRSGDERLALKKDESWTPVIQISPFYPTTFTIQVSAVPELTVPLKARLYPEFGVFTPTTELAPVGNGVYTGTLELDYPYLVGDVQVWAGEGPRPAETDRQVIVPYSIGGNPSAHRGGGSAHRGGGSAHRGGGSAHRGGGSAHRGGGAPAVSPDGQMIFFTTNSITNSIPLAEGQFYTVQDMAALPPLPQGKTAIGQGYNLFATPGTPLTGSISFQYLGADALTEKLNEEGERGLKIHYWNDEQGWQALGTRTDNKYNLASARSQGPGVYALLAGVTKPDITACSPSVAAKGVTATLTLTGGNFLAPVQVVLSNTNTYTLPAHIASTAAITAEIPAYYLPVQEYELVVVNGDQGTVLAPCTLGVFEPEPEEACFYDFFGSGANKWQRDGDWDIVTILPGGEQAMTDSPIGPYKNAGDYGSGVITYTTSMTTTAFDLTGCADPVLAFRHDYVIAQGPTHQDVARVEISADDGATWSELASYSGGGIFGEGPEARDVESPEWADVKWKNAWIRLDAYTGTVRLRFSLEVDQNVSDKGWVIDRVMAQSGHHVFLPLILENE